MRRPVRTALADRNASRKNRRASIVLFASALTSLLSAAHLIRPSRPVRTIRRSEATKTAVCHPPADATQAPLTVWEIDSDECPGWDALVQDHPHGTLFHTLAWRRAMLRRGMGRATYLAAMRGDRVVAILPLMMFARHPDAPCLSSLPDCPAAGLLSVDEPALRTLWERLLLVARSRGVRRIEWARYATAGSLARTPTGPAWVCMSSREAAEIVAPHDLVAVPALHSPKAAARLALRVPAVLTWLDLSQADPTVAGLTLIYRRGTDTDGMPLGAWGASGGHLHVFQTELGSLSQTRRILAFACEASAPQSPRRVHIQLPDAAWILKPDWRRSAAILVAQPHHVEL